MNPLTIQDVLTQKFSADELRILCADLYCPYDDLAKRSEGHSSLALNICIHAQNIGDENRLTSEIYKRRPKTVGSVWKQIATSIPASHPPPPVVQTSASSPQRFFVVATTNGEEEVFSFSTEKEAAAAVNIYKRRGTPTEVYFGSKI